MIIDAMLQADVGTNLPVASHIQNDKHGTSADSAVGWYILRCGGGLDFAACDALAKAGWAAFVPVERKWRITLFRRRAIEAKYPRYPGYLFVRTLPPLWPAWDSWPLNRYLRSGPLMMDGRPVPLAPGEMERLQAEDGTAVVSGVPPLHRAFTAGQVVRVIGGAFADNTIRIEAIDEDGAHATIDIFGRPTTVRLQLNWLKAA